MSEERPARVGLVSVRRITICLFPMLGLPQLAVADLNDFIDQQGSQATNPQAQVAGAISAICPDLVTRAFEDLDDALAAGASEEKDITLRCNELIATGTVLSDSPGPTSRDLGVGSSSLLAALQQVNGEELLAQGTMATRASNGQFSNIGARLGALRLGAGVAGSATLTGNFDFGSGWGVATQRGGGAAADAGAPFGPLGWFVNGAYSTGDKDASNLEDGFDFDAVSLSFGLDYNFGKLVLGGTLGYDDYQADFDVGSLVSGGDVQADGLSGSVFASYDENNLYVTGIVTVGSLDYDVTRRLQYESENSDPSCQCPSQDRVLTGSPDGDHTAAGVSVGYLAVRESWTIDPHWSFSWRDVEIDGYTEADSMSSSGMEFRYDAQNFQSLRSVLGIQLTRNINVNFGSVRPILRLDWHHEFDDGQRAIRAKYAIEDELAALPASDLFGSGPNPFGAGFDDCLSCFSILTEEPDDDFYLLGLGASALLKNALQLFIYYEGLLGYENLDSHSIVLGIRGQF